MFGFLKVDGAVAAEQLAVFDRTRAGTIAIGTRLRLVDTARLLGGGVFAELLSDLAADVVGTLFDRSEIEVVQGFVGAEDLLGNRFENLLQTRVES